MEIGSDGTKEVGRCSVGWHATDVLAEAHEGQWRVVGSRLLCTVSGGHPHDAT